MEELKVLHNLGSLKKVTDAKGIHSCYPLQQEFKKYNQVMSRKI